MQLQRNSESLTTEYDRKMVELREASRRLKEDYEHQLNLERTRYDDLQQRFQKQANETRELEGKLKERENEVFSLKESMIKRPEVKMQSDMNLLLLEKVLTGFVFFFIQYRVWASNDSSLILMYFCKNEFIFEGIYPSC